METWKFPVNADAIAILLHDPKCNPNGKINEYDYRFRYKAYSGMICGWSVGDNIIPALLSWRGLVDTDQIVSATRHITVADVLGVARMQTNQMNLRDMKRDMTHNAHPEVILIERYMENPNQVRKECRMKFSACKEHDSAAIFVQILFLSEQFFVSK